MYDEATPQRGAVPSETRQRTRELCNEGMRTLSNLFGARKRPGYEQSALVELRDLFKRIEEMNRG